MINMRLSEAARALDAPFIGDDVHFEGCSTDSRQVRPDSLFIALKGERFDGHAFIESALAAGAVASLTETELPEYTPMIVVEDSLRAMGKLANTWRSRFAIPLVAITGSNGKTTVKEMLLAILQQQGPVLATKGNLNNEIGVPLTLFNLDSEHACAVIEMGANHAGEIARLTRIARPTVAVITQCAPAHLEGFGSIDGVASAKAEIYEGLEEEGIAVINADDDYAPFWSGKTTNLAQLTFGVESAADIRATHLQSYDNGMQFDLELPNDSLPVQLQLPGKHNVMNALAASACAMALGIEARWIKSGLENMTGIKGRLEKTTGIRYATIINDSYNANPASLNAALELVAGLAGERWLVLGDMGELGNDSRALHAAAGEKARLAGVDRLFTIGELSRAASETFGNGAQHYTDLDPLIAELQQSLNASVTLLVKASRAMQLERVVAALEEKH